MAVYTKISDTDIASHLVKYSVGELLDFKEIIEGIDNSTFILQTSKGKFILTIFESRINKEELPFFMNLKAHLAKKGICCPYPILDNQGSIINELKGKKSVIVSFLDGKPVKKITANSCFEVGKIMAKSHLAAADFEMSRSNELGICGFRNLFKKFDHLLDSYQKGLREEILENLDFLDKSWRHDLPSAAVHLDLFCDNVFFDEEEKVCGVIDFYFAANDLLIYDFAITATAWEDGVQGNIDDLMRGYEEVRKFSADEKNFLKIAFVGASMRFLLTRLHDMFFAPKDSLVKIKDPQEFLAKLRHFKSQI